MLVHGFSDFDAHILFIRSDDGHFLCGIAHSGSGVPLFAFVEYQIVEFLCSVVRVHVCHHLSAVVSDERSVLHNMVQVMALSGAEHPSLTTACFSNNDESN
jgi:hypothetical protein